MWHQVLGQNLKNTLLYIYWFFYLVFFLIFVLKAVKIFFFSFIIILTWKFFLISFLYIGILSLGRHRFNSNNVQGLKLESRYSRINQEQAWNNRECTAWRDFGSCWAWNWPGRISSQSPKSHLCPDVWETSSFHCYCL